MKKPVLILLVMIISMGTLAVPARHSVWKTITIDGGQQVSAQLMGDELLHYWRTTKGDTYIYNSATSVYEQTNGQTLAFKAQFRRQQIRQQQLIRPAQQRVQRRSTVNQQYNSLCILVNFTDRKFNASDSLVLYNRLMNEEGFSVDKFQGSVKDYFHAQSNGTFAPIFDVVGPVTVSKGYAYYGANDTNGYDKLPQEMIMEACKAVDNDVDFSKYDNNGDGYVDQVIVIYAGSGEAVSGATDDIWPHEWSLSGSGNALKLDGVSIDTYACSSELGLNNTIDGIGTICHEFSHCLGLPDMYDTQGSNYGMDTWDLMDYGCYSGDGFLPVGYTSYEKMLVGWLTPIELTAETNITTMNPLSQNGEAYIIYNQANKNEYYLLENRQQIGWDREVEGKGLLVLHVDYDATAWYENIINTDVNHQRCTIIPADGKLTALTNANDPYPYLTNDSLTNKSIPAATLFNPNTNGKKLMYCKITDIKQNADGTIAFNFAPQVQEVVVDTLKNYLFYESFDQCSGKGGNDSLWNGNIANSTFVSDNEGWVADKKYGANKCAKFGTSSGSVDVVVSTPGIALNGTAQLTFKAADWDSTTDGTSLQLSVNNGYTIKLEGSADEKAGLVQLLTMKKGEWTDYTVTINGNGTVYLTFIPAKRFFLDEVLVKQSVDTGIQSVRNNLQHFSGRIYSISGQYLGTDFNALSSGVYIIDGRKVVK